MTILMTLTVLATAPAWAGAFEDTLLEASTKIRQEHAEIAERVDQMEPVRNRAGNFAFPGADLADTRAQTLIQHRVIFGQDDLNVRVALAFALDGQHRLPWSVVDDLPAELRGALINGYKQDGGLDAVDAFEGALTDVDSSVRAEAMRLIGYRVDTTSTAITDALQAGLTDSSADIRRFAARSIAWRSETWGFDAVTPLLSDTDPGVRGAAVRALAQLDKQRAQSMPAVQALKTDDHPKVRRPIKTLFKL